MNRIQGVLDGLNWVCVASGRQSGNEASRVPQLNGDGDFVGEESGSFRSPEEQ